MMMEMVRVILEEIANGTDPLVANAVLEIVMAMVSLM